MATYVPNADDLTQPTGDKPVKSAAPEFRALKGKVARAVAVPEAGEYPDLPVVANRAGKVLGFDAGGNPTMVTVSGTSDPSLRADIANASNANNGDALVGSKKVGVVDALETTQHAVNEQRTVNAVLDYGMATTNTRAQNDTALTKALNSGAKTIFIPSGYPNKYLMSLRKVITAAAQGIRVVGEDKQNTVLSWLIDTATVEKFGFLLDGFVTLENLTIENTGTDLTSSVGICSNTPTVNNGFHDGATKNVRVKGWGIGVGATIDGVASTLTRSQVFSNKLEIEFDGCGIPISLGSGCNDNELTVTFLNNKGNRHIKLLEGANNRITGRFEPVDVSVTTGMLNAELIKCIGTKIKVYGEPVYGFLADSSPGTVIDAAAIEGFNFTIGTLSSSAILRSTDASNGGTFAAPMVSWVRLPTSRASSNPISYAASDDNANTITLVDAVSSRDANFTARPTAQRGKVALNYPRPTSVIPTIIGSSGTSAHTYLTQVATAQRIGDRVFIDFEVALTAKDAGMGGNASVSFSGVPWNVATGTKPGAAFSEYGPVDLSAGYTQLMGEGVAGTVRFLLVQGGDNVAVLALPAAGIVATTVIAGSFSYLTDAL